MSSDAGPDTATTLGSTAGAGGYRQVPAHIDLPAMDRAMIALWRERDVFARSLAQTAEGEPWIFYEGPPTANGQPGTHHIEARVFKDVFPRYRTMKGRYVPRQAGWDCHGLPVELAVEKELGFSGKGDIEQFGVAEFNAKCRESVLRHVGEFATLTERMGYWVDMDSAYWTMAPAYVESVWWSLKNIFDKGLLVQDHRVSPYCPRCGTGLSDHELSQGYESVIDPSVFVRFPITSGPLADINAALLVWTTTPWTLVSNTAAAVGADIEYVAVRVPLGDANEVLVVAEDLRVKVLGEDATDVVWRGLGRDLEGTSYQRPFALVEFPTDADPRTWTVLLADFVTTSDGSGLVHEAPAFGAEDLALCRSYGLPVVNPLAADGTFFADIDLVGGLFFKKADEVIVAELARTGLLHTHLPYEHDYPHCWRCHTPLVYYAQPSWYIRTTEIKDALLRENGTTNWFPPTIAWGRYGDWLNNNVDWALSRNRYWGTPLPIWRCDEGHLTCVGSLAELGSLAGQELSALDPHRPYVDDITLPCPTCNEVAHRVPEVIDCWYDSGAMPFAQLHYPHKEGSVELFAQRYPADFICEAIDQTRGWFYTLMAIGTLVFDESSYRNVLCLGHILDEDGRKMSKHLGNVLEPIGLMDTHGADAVRWFMLAGGSPWQARRVGHNTISDVVRKTLLTYWNTVSFLALYGRTNGFEPSAASAPAPQDRHIVDRWALAQAHRLARDVDVALEQFDTQQAGRVLAAYIDDLSNWYVRRSRRRFWDGDPGALATLHECLRIVTLLMAPFTPFVSERVWQDLFLASDSNEPESVHLAAWPAADESLIDDQLTERMSLVRRLVELGRATRASSKIGIRQPLSRALVSAQGWDDLPENLRAQIADELNVSELVSLTSHLGGDTSLVDVTVKANFRELGRRFGKGTQPVAAAIASADPVAFAAALRDGTAVVQVDGQSVPISTEECVITETPREGWAVASDAGESVALDLEITPELRRRGIARDVVRLVQDARKSAGLDVSDRIDLAWDCVEPEVVAALNEHGALIVDEVLALTFGPLNESGSSPSTAVADVEDPDLALRVVLWSRKN